MFLTELFKYPQFWFLWHGAFAAVILFIFIFIFFPFIFFYASV